MMYFDLATKPHHTLVQRIEALERRCSLLMFAVVAVSVPLVWLAASGFRAIPQSRDLVETQLVRVRDASGNIVAELGTRAGKSGLWLHDPATASDRAEFTMGATGPLLALNDSTGLEQLLRLRLTSSGNPGLVLHRNGGCQGSGPHDVCGVGFGYGVFREGSSSDVGIAMTDSKGNTRFVVEVDDTKSNVTLQRSHPRLGDAIYAILEARDGDVGRLTLEDGNRKVVFRTPK